MGSGSGFEHEKKKQLPLPHVLMVSFPAQGHINPLLRLAKRIVSKGILVTFATTLDFANSNINVVSNHPFSTRKNFLHFEFIDDEWPKGDPRRHDLDIYIVQLESVFRRRIPHILTRQSQSCRPVSCFVYNPFIPWVSDVADEVGLPSAMLWIQSSACFLSTYYYHHKLVPFPDENTPHINIEIPTLPLLKWYELPSYLIPTTPFPLARGALVGQFENISKPFCVLVDTLYELEKGIIDHINTICPIKPVGPLFKDPKARPGPETDEECTRWLNGKAARSVVYISFGTQVVVKKKQINEIAGGIAGAGVPFLWVMKDSHVLPEGFLDKAGENGKVVQFSPQEQVLAHPSVACFMTHCGWNSTIESLTLGVPIIAFPYFADQVTNAKFLCDVFGIGIQLSKGMIYDRRIISKEEVEACLRAATTGPKAAELKSNALKWKAAAEMAVAEGNSSDRNIQDFVDEICKRSKVVFASTFNNMCKAKL